MTHNGQRKVKFRLSIGYVGCDREEWFTLDQLGIDEDDYETEEELREVLDDALVEWQNDHIMGGFDLEEEDE
jgi:hypothetical protein